MTIGDQSGLSSLMQNVAFCCRRHRIASPLRIHIGPLPEWVDDTLQLRHRVNGEIPSQDSWFKEGRQTLTHNDVGNIIHWLFRTARESLSNSNRTRHKTSSSDSKCFVRVERAEFPNQTHEVRAERNSARNDSIQNDHDNQSAQKHRIRSVLTCDSESVVDDCGGIKSLRSQCDTLSLSVEILLRFVML
jgi:hypothetical protein